MLVGLNGRPLVARASATRNEFTEQRVNAELQQLDSNLHIRWMPLAVALPSGGREGRYALCSYWPQIDPRREWVQRGEYSPEEAFDIIGWFCTDMQDATTVPEQPEAILTKVLELLYKCDNTRQPWKRRMAECIEHNKKREQKVKQEAVEEMRDVASDLYYHSNRATRVFQTR